MISDFREVENAYIRTFSEMEERGDHVVFRDERLPDMYAFNCTLIKRCASQPADLATRMLAEAKENNRDFLQLILHPGIEVSPSFGQHVASAGFNVETNLYMELAAAELDGFRGNEDCTVIRAAKEEELADGQRLDVETSVGAGVPPEFAVRKSFRKMEIFRDSAKQLFSYLCYHQDHAIGKCELFVHRGYAKIEDFDVLPSYQRKGFGTAMLKKMITDARRLGAQHIYLIAGKGDTPREMYRKLGFTVIGEETQLLWRR